MGSRKGTSNAKAKPADKAPEKEEAGKPRESSGSAGIVHEPPSQPDAGRSPGSDGGGDAGQPAQRAPADEVAKPGEPRQSSGDAGIVQEPPAPIVAVVSDPAPVNDPGIALGEPRESSGTAGVIQEPPAVPGATNTPENEATVSGAGDPAGPAATYGWRGSEAYPNLAAALARWKATHEDWPAGLRITSKKEGFRRAGIAHSRVTQEYPLERFNLPADGEALFAEPNLVVELI